MADQEEEEEEQLDYGETSPSPEAAAKKRISDKQLEEDLYGDLVPESFLGDPAQQEKLQELTEKSQQQAKKLQELEEDLAVCTEERDALREEKTILVRNISCLFRTAQMEIDRKDAEIKRLRGPVNQWASNAPPPRPFH